MGKRSSEHSLLWHFQICLPVERRVKVSGRLVPERETEQWPQAGLMHAARGRSVCVRPAILKSATPGTVAHQAPLSMGFSRQEYWSGLHFLLQGIFPTQGLNPCLL